MKTKLVFIIALILSNTAMAQSLTDLETMREADHTQDTEDMQFQAQRQREEQHDQIDQLSRKLEDQQLNQDFWRIYGDGK
jgi:hypothetical protein